MKSAEKKQLVMVGIRRKGETRFKLKMLKSKSDREQIEFTTHGIMHKQSTHPSHVGL